jgi:DNA-directed RNA polymerase III subunit RPC3
LVIEELLKSGIALASSVIVRAYANSDIKNIQEFRDSFIDLLCDKYIFRCPECSDDPVPVEIQNLTDIYRVPNIKLNDIIEMVKNGTNCDSTDNSYFTVNFDKFHQSFRDRVLLEAIERQIDSNAAECLQYILQLMYDKTDGWAHTTNPISFSNIRRMIEKKSSNNELIKFYAEYISMIEKDQSGFFSKDDESGHGMYVINMRNAITQIAWSVIENVVTQKYGSKAARILRVVRTKKMITQNDIQRESMIPAKSVRLNTYKLMDENFLQTRTLRKSMTPMGPIRSYYYFQVNQQQIVRNLIEACYKAMYNSKVRTMQDVEANNRLTEKAMRLQFIVDKLKDQGESDETIEEIKNATIPPPEKELLEKSKLTIRLLKSAEIKTDETLFLLQLFLNYQMPEEK